MNPKAQIHHDATYEADEITAVHTPDPALLRIARISVLPQRPPPPPSRRAKLQLLPLQILRTLLERYSEAAGPAARPLMLKAILDLNATPEQFPLLLRGELIRVLSQRLDNPQTRASFIDDANRITHEVSCSSP
jgi:hypothetical protein